MQSGRDKRAMPGLGLRASKYCVSSNVCTTSAEVGVCHVLWRDLILQFRMNKDEPSLPDSEESGGLSSREHMENEAAPQLNVAFESWEQSMQASLLRSELGRIIKMQKQILDDVTRNFQKSKHVQQQTQPLMVASTCL